MSLSGIGPSGAAAGGAPDDRLTRLYDLTVDRLIEILADGVPIQKNDAKTGETRVIGRAPAPPAYVSAAIKLLKDAGAWAADDPTSGDIAQMLEGLPSFDADEDEDAEAADEGPAAAPS